MNDQVSKHDQVLLALAMNLQGIAMVQLGKITSPTSGAIERDLDAARGTIDILEMLKVKCRHDTPEPVLHFLDQAVMDLQMNYLDEFKRDRREKEHGAGLERGERDPAADAAGPAGKTEEEAAGMAAGKTAADASGSATDTPGAAQT